MLTNKQSLFFCGLVAIGIFVGGVLDILDNFIMLTVLTLLFFTIILNLFYTNSKKKNQDTDNKKKVSN